MSTFIHSWPAMILSLAVTAGAAHAQSSPAEERLRDQLRQTTMALRDAQDTVADLKAQLEKANGQLEAQRTVQSAVSSKTNVAGETAALRTAVEERNHRIAEVQQRYEESLTLLGQWQQAYRQAAGLAKARDADAKKFEQQFSSVSERQQTCVRDNAELVQISRQILDKYRKKGVWTALRDAEPITQIQRIRLESLAQDYGAKIEDLTVVPPGVEPLPTNAAEASKK